MLHAAICAAILLLAGAAAAEQLTLYSLATGDRFVDLGQDGGAGNMTLWHSEIQDEEGNRLGTGAGACIRLDAAVLYEVPPRQPGVPVEPLIRRRHPSAVVARED